VTLSSLPLRGIETVRGDIGTPRGGAGPHCPYEGLKLQRPAALTEVTAGPHCPYEGLKRVEVAGLWSARRGPHCPYEGLKPDRYPASAYCNHLLVVLIAPTRD